jgi:hypothetical protein
LVIENHIDLRGGIVRFRPTFIRALRQSVYAPAPTQAAKFSRIKWLFQSDLHRLVVGLGMEKLVAVFGFDAVNLARRLASAPPFFREASDRITFEILKAERFNHTRSREWLERNNQTG